MYMSPYIVYCVMDTFISHKILLKTLDKNEPTIFFLKLVLVFMFIKIIC